MKKERAGLNRLPVFGRLRVFGLLVLILGFGMGAGSARVAAAQNGFGDEMTADAFFPTRNLSAFGPDQPSTKPVDALIANAEQDGTSPTDADAASLSAIMPAAGDAARPGVDAHSDLYYGPFQPSAPHRPANTAH